MTQQHNNAIPARFALASLVLLLLTLVLGGCGSSGKGDGAGGGNTTAAANTNTGGTTTRGALTLTIRWPEVAGSTRVIPAATQSIRVAVLVGTQLVQETVNRPEGSTETTQNITVRDTPTGNAVVRAFAFVSPDGGGTILASGETRTVIDPNPDNRTVVEMSELPPGLTSNAFIIGGGVAPDPDRPDFIRITLNALIDGADGRPVRGLTAENFEVIEDGILRRPIEVNSVDGTTSKADIAFVVDTTGSMSEEIAGVRNSIIAFADQLKASGVDVRFAGSDYGDNIRSIFNFTDDVVAFRGWVQTLRATGGGSFPENALDSLMALARNQAFRPDAQKILIIITDATTHQAGDGSSEHSTPETVAGVIAELRGRFVVEAISPGHGRSVPTRAESLLAEAQQGGSGESKTPTRATRQTTTPVDVQEISDGTGGAWVRLPSNGNVDLNALGIGEVVLAGYIVRYRADRTGTTHNVRLLVRQGGLFVAEQFFTGTY